MPTLNQRLADFEGQGFRINHRAVDDAIGALGCNQSVTLTFPCAYAARGSVRLTMSYGPTGSDFAWSMVEVAPACPWPSGEHKYVNGVCTRCNHRS